MLGESNQDLTAYRSFINHKAAGLELAEYMAGRFTYYSLEDWSKHIKNGEVFLNGELVDPKITVKLGDEVKYMARTRPEPLVPKQIPIIYEDNDLIIVNKPAHLPVHPTGRFLRNTMIHILKKQLKLDFLILAHRLDRETTGCCVLSKTPLAKDKMYWQFFNNEVDKLYWALVWGEPEKKSGVIDAPIGSAHGPDSKSKSPIRIKQECHGAKARSARTKYHTLSTQQIDAPEWEPPEWEALKRVNPNMHSPWTVSLIEAKPITGRTNQIRVHLGEIGTGVIGDKLYDPTEEVFMQVKGIKPDMDTGKGAKGEFVKIPENLAPRLVLDAQALHARQITFRHPRTGKLTTVKAPAPKSWQNFYDLP